MSRDTFVRTRSSALLVSLAVLLAACVGGSGTAPSASPAPPVVTPAISPSNVQLTEADNGGTVTVPVGSEVTLQLGSTYWQVEGSSDAAVLELVSGPDTSAAPMGACLPGAGCGNVTAVFRAVGPGQAAIQAGRTSCGEALQCSGTAGAYQVTIVVAR